MEGATYLSRSSSVRIRFMVGFEGRLKVQPNGCELLFLA